ncbi:MAG: STY4528 family pathogenicity island replication protein, partial [Pseudomonadota bacterium]|nr:STY4528 family pathogenicity island replication protein [Pseudomonadota bacterium]
MSSSESKIRPATQALDALIRRTISQVRETTNDKPADARLFLGNRHQAFPARLVQDPVLEPVDKVVWMVICQHGQAAGPSTAFPSYNTIARQANIASPATVSRAIALLRATRWLSVCARVRDNGGRFRGNVYALHDEPLPLADAIHLDSDYLAFVEAARQHHHARVRKVAGVVLASIDDDSKAGVDVIAPVVPVTAQRCEGVREAGPRHCFSFSASVLPRLANQAPARPMNNRNPDSKNDADRLRNLSPQKSKSVGSSSYINITTTTKTNKIQKLNTDSERESLIYPRRLIADQRELAARYLERVPVEQRQSVLDELEGRIRAEKHGAKPVYDELRYLHHLCTQV